MKFPPIDRLDGPRRRVMLGRRELQGMPAHPPLFAKDSHGSKDIAALKRKRMIEDMQYAHLILSTGQDGQPYDTVTHHAPEARCLSSQPSVNTYHSWLRP